MVGRVKECGHDDHDCPPEDVCQQPDVPCHPGCPPGKCNQLAIATSDSVKDCLACDGTACAGKVEKVAAAKAQSNPAAKAASMRCARTGSPK